MKLAILGAALLHATTFGAHAAVAPACPTGVPTQRITVVNQANVRPIVLAKIEHAATDQSMQLRAAWGTPCVSFGPGGWVFTVGRSVPIHNWDGSTTYQVTGQHTYNGVVTATITIDQPMNLGRVLTHEMDEALVDPQANKPFGFGLLEVCDPVQLQTYPLDGVQVSDFALPAHFYGGSGPYDHMGLLAS